MFQKYLSFTKLVLLECKLFHENTFNNKENIGKRRKIINELNGQV